MIAPLPDLDVRFAVRGTPLSKGSMSGFPISRGECTECRPKKPCGRRNCFRGILVGVSVTDQGGPELDVWQQEIHYAALSARNAARQRLVESPGAVAVTLIFVMPRPASHWTALGTLSSGAKERPFPTTKPDLDKMTRVVKDAMTGALVQDDAQVTIARLGEVYADRAGWTGVTVHARRLRSLDAWVEHELAYHGVWSPMEPSRQEALL